MSIYSRLLPAVALLILSAWTCAEQTLVQNYNGNASCEIIGPEFVLHDLLPESQGDVYRNIAFNFSGNGVLVKEDRKRTYVVRFDSLRKIVLTSNGKIIIVSKGLFFDSEMEMNIHPRCLPLLKKFLAIFTGPSLHVEQK